MKNVRSKGLMANATAWLIVFITLVICQNFVTAQLNKPITISLFMMTSSIIFGSYYGMVGEKQVPMIMLFIPLVIMTPMMLFMTVIDVAINMFTNLKRLILLGR